ncbi:PAS domain-containing hybrid sensor histidine kinase/response regulator [Thiomicrorhabdus sp. Milos-T2]|uniref:PAS domain-containing hybrid sensor histidine kinase/response regulator n=1 Tax=Thiomicrorhabdus sp. Milos-T2 TaxID=90814 RepID=UPI00068F8E66|nr:ATP-binding protein [Thiomicrorhabdus sp. Milos-T2]
MTKFRQQSLLSKKARMAIFNLPLTFWLSMLSAAVLVIALVYYIVLQNESRVTQAAQLSANGLASYVGDYVEKHQLLVKSIVSHHQDRILQLSKGGGYPYDLAEISDDVDSLFPKNTEFAIVNQKGDVIVASHNDGIGKKCRDLIKFTMNAGVPSVSNVRSHHFQSGLNHFDIFQQIIVGDEIAGFWVKLSFKPLEPFINSPNFKEYDLVIAQQAPLNNILLGKNRVQTDEGNTHFKFINQMLKTDDGKDVLAIVPVANIGWQVRALINASEHQKYVQHIVLIALALFMAFFVVVAIVVFLVRTLQQEKEKIRQDAVHDEMFNAGPTVLLEKQIDQKMLVLYASPNAELLFAKTSKALINKPYLDWIFPEDAIMVRQTLINAYKNQLPSVEMVYRIRKANNKGFKWIYDLSHILYNSSGQPDSIRGYITSVHAQKTAEKNATDLIQSVPEAIFVLDLNGKILNTNRAAESLLGCNKTQLVNAVFRDWLDTESLAHYESLKQAFIEALSLNTNAVSEMDKLYLKSANGALVAVEISLNSIELNAKPLLVQVVRNVTLQQQAQKQLSLAKEEAEDLAKARSRFVATISHEIRTPMNGVLGMADLLFDTPLTPIQEEYLQAIKQSGDVLLNIINEVLDFAKLDEGKVVLSHVKFNLKQAAEETLHLLSPMAEEKGLALTLHYSDELHETFMGDVLRIQQLLFNLVGNAIKFTEQGHVQIKVTPAKADADTGVDAGADEDDNYPVQGLLIEVEDSGIGIAKEHLNRLFDSFTQADESTSRKFGGTGLGLAICKQLVDLMNGHIVVLSEINKGSTFQVRLPLEIPASEEKAKFTASNALISHEDTVIQEDMDSLPLTGINVLLIEDNTINQNVIKAFVKRLGAKVDIAENGLKGVDFWRLGEGKYQLILMDCQMPVMDGFDATKIIRKEEALSYQQSSVPIIALTANVLTDDRSRCFQVGMNDFLAKPINREQFDATLIKWAQ